MMKALVTIATVTISVCGVLMTSATAQQQQDDRPPECQVRNEDDDGKGAKVDVCDDGVHVSVSGKEMDNFLKHPFGESDRSVPKDINRAKKTTIKRTEKWVADRMGW